MSQSNNDCYFYYYSTCSKGDFCPFRHEPAALFQETVCSFWMQGKCTKINCSFRHMMNSMNNQIKNEKDRSQIKCFWESQPTGCTKAHCPFMHGNRVVLKQNSYIPDATVPASPLPGSIPGAVKSKIIVNKNKLEEIALSNPVVATAANRTVLLPKGKITVKHRLGKRMDENITEDISNEHSAEIDSEEESLRRGAISTIDLRKRLSSKPVEAPIASKRRHSSSDADSKGSDIEAEETPKIRSVVKKS